MYLTIFGNIDGMREGLTNLFILKDRPPQVPSDVRVRTARRRKEIKAAVFLKVPDSPRVDAPEVHLSGLKGQAERELIRKDAKDHGIQPRPGSVEVIRVAYDAQIFIGLPLVEAERSRSHRIAIEVLRPPFLRFAFENVSG